MFECGGGGELKRADWLRKMCLALIILWGSTSNHIFVFRTSTMFGAFRPTNVLSGGLLWYIPPIVSSIVNSGAFGLTELCVQEDPMATLQIPESATTQAVTGCR